MRVENRISQEIIRPHANSLQIVQNKPLYQFCEGIYLFLFLQQGTVATMSHKSQRAAPSRNPLLTAAHRALA
jgi:hypothetical protein